MTQHKGASFRFSRFYEFQNGRWIRTHLSTLVYCCDGLPPIPEILTNSDNRIIKFAYTPYLGRVKKQLINEGIPIQESYMNTGSRPTTIFVLDGYDQRYALTDVDQVVIGILRIPVDRFNEEFIRNRYKRGRIVIYDPLYDVYIPLPGKIQWISRASLSDRQRKTVRRITQNLFGEETEPIVTYRYSFNGYIALLYQGYQGNLFYHAYRPSSATWSGQSYIMLQKDKTISYAVLSHVQEHSNLRDVIQDIKTTIREMKSVENIPKAKIGLRYFGEGNNRDICQSDEVNQILITANDTGIVALQRHLDIDFKKLDELLNNAIAVSEGVGLESYMITIKRQDLTRILNIRLSDWVLPEEPTTLVAKLTEKNRVEVYELHIMFE